MVVGSMRMIKAGGGIRSPEEAKKSPVNPKPDPAQVAVNECVDRSRFINLNASIYSLSSAQFSRGYRIPNAKALYHILRVYTQFIEAKI